jgi:hypothetical protein
MLKCWYLLPAMTAILLTGCGKERAKPGDWVGADPSTQIVTNTRKGVARDTGKGQGAKMEELKVVARPDTVLPKLSTLLVPGGWRNNFDPLANQWHIDKEVVVSDFGAKRLTRITISRSPTEIEPAALDAYVKFLQKPDEQGFIWPQVMESGAVDGGFYIVAKVRTAIDVTANVLDTGLCVVRTINGDRLKFKCIKLPDELRGEALELCRGARF